MIRYKRNLPQAFYTNVTDIYRIKQQYADKYLQSNLSKIIVEFDESNSDNIIISSEVTDTIVILYPTSFRCNVSERSD